MNVVFTPHFLLMPNILNRFMYLFCKVRVGQSIGNYHPTYNSIEN